MKINNKRMINRLMTELIQKKQKLRNAEYYNIQSTLDGLYEKATKNNNYKFYKLLDIISSEENIRLAYRNIKRNPGSSTSGTNNHTIEDIASVTTEELVKYIRERLKNYNPHEVRRVEIPKDNGKTRPLGIPTIEDRIIQQCIKQVLEPICEAKFHNHSYGFRPNRSTHNAMARCMRLAQQSNLHYVVDIDIKGFFDNVNHGKLLKQMWNLGIQDKQLLSIISKMLKAPVQGLGVQNKGTPQGGILSPLLSNIVLNELDWWISDQWETFKTKKNYERIDKRDGSVIRTNKFRALKKTKMKEVYIVRYADDFKLFCRDYESAKRIFIATKEWLKERLHLEISPEKSKIVNLRTNYSEYLGFKLKVHKKGTKYVVKSHMSDKAKNKCTTNLKEQIKTIQKRPTIREVNKYNSMVLGMQNYYKIATNINIDCSNISYKVSKSLNIRLKNRESKTGIQSELYKKLYGKYNFKKKYILGISLFPIAGVINTPPMSFSQDICDYTEIGRTKIHSKLKGVSIKNITYLLNNPIQTQSTEYNDNRISLYVGQNGLCNVTKEVLDVRKMECHHKKPKVLGGMDNYQNLILLKTEVHKLIHAITEEKINKYMTLLNLDDDSLKKLNKLRVLAGNHTI